MDGPIGGVTTGDTGVDLSYEDAYRQYSSVLSRLAFLMTGSSLAAEDVVHDVFIRAERNWSAVVTPLPYLRRAVVLACRDQARQHRRRDAREDRANRASAARHDSDLPVDLAEWRDVLMELPERQRAVIVLRYFDGLDDAHIAGALRCREATVRSSARRALARLRDVISNAD